MSPDTQTDTRPGPASPSATTKLAIAGAWLAVGVPLLWGVAETFMKALALFRI